MVLLEKLRKEQAVIGSIFAIVVLVLIQTTLFIPQITESYIIRTEAILLLPRTLILLAIYLIFPIVSSAVITLFIHPKRIVSPFFVQIGTVVVVMFMIIYKEASSGLMDYIQLQNLIVSIPVSLFMSGTIGWLQKKAVVAIVGLEHESMEQSTYLIGEPLEDVLAILGDEFRKVWIFSKEKDVDNIHIFKMDDYAQRAVVIAIGSNPDDEKSTIFSTVSFQITSRGIKSSKMATAVCNSVINDIKQRLSPSGITKIENQSESSLIEQRAHTRALDITKSKIEVTQEFLRKLPKEYRLSFYTTICFLIAIIATFTWGIIDFDIFLPLSITLLIVLTVELGVPLTKAVFEQRSSEKNRVK